MRVFLHGKRLVQSNKNDFGAHIIAIRLLLEDIHNEDVSLFLVPSYAPVGNAPHDVWNEYLYKLTTCIERKRKSDILIIGTDANSSMGTTSARTHGPLGCFTIKMALKKRREHGLESWVLFLDLVKNFDRVPREML